MRRRWLEVGLMVGLVAWAGWQFRAPSPPPPPAASPSPSASPTRKPEGPLPLYYEADQKVWRVDAKGVRHGTRGLFPALSQDRRKIAFYDKEQLKVEEEDGSVRVIYANPLYYGGIPSWSRDDQWIYFILCEEPNQGVYRISAAGGRPVRICDGMDVVCSPDGRHIAFAATSGLTIANVDGTDPHIVHPFGTDPSWSPDGSQLFYAVVEDDVLKRYDLAAMRSDKVHSKALGPLWSPDGQSIAYTPMDNSDHICVMRPDGSQDRILGKTDGPLAWAGPRLAYLERAAHGYNAWTMLPDGTDKKLLLRQFAKDMPVLATNPH